MKKIINFFKITKQKISDYLYKNRYGTIMLLVGVIVAFWDLTTKFLFDGQETPVLKGIFSIFSTHNTGGAWSIFSNATLVLIIVSCVFIVGIVMFNYYLKTKTYFYAISMGILLSGAVCNLYDRMAFGYVRDFIKLEFINFPVFNIADMAICIGVALLAIYFIFILPKLEKQKKLVKENEQKYFDELSDSISTELTQENANLKNNEILSAKEQLEEQEQLNQTQEIILEQQTISKTSKKKTTSNTADKNATKKSPSKSSKKVQTASKSKKVNSDNAE